MKKLLSITLILCFAAASCKTDKSAETTILGILTNYQPYPDKLNGRVRSISERNYLAVQQGESFVKGGLATEKDLDSLGTTWTPNADVVFDENGNIISYMHIDENNNAVYELRVIKEGGIMTRADIYVEGILNRYLEIGCDDDGNITDLDHYQAGVDTLINSCTVTRDANNLITEIQFYGPKRVPTYTDKYTYNPAGQYLTFERYNSQGELRSGTAATYDPEGIMLKIEFFNSAREITGENHFTMKTDETGNWTEAIVKDIRGFTIIEERVYTYY